MNKTYFDNCFVVLACLYFTESFKNIQLGTGLIPDVVLSLINWGLAFGAVLRIAIEYKWILPKVRRDRFLATVLVLVFASFLWSLNPGRAISLIRGVLFPTTAFGLYLAICFDLKTMLRKITYGLIAGLLVCWFFAIAVPSVGIVPEGNLFAGAWRGVYGHKNAVSANMLLTAIVLLLGSFRRSPEKWFGIYRRIWLRCLGLSALLFVFLTTSGTGLGSAVIIVSLLYFYRGFRWRGRASVLAIELAVMVLAPLAVGWQAIVIAMGKDATLTGRTLFWDIAIDAIINQRPILGFGRSGFWASANLGRIAAAFGGNYVPPHAHNGYIEIALDIGIVGFVIFLASLLLTFAKALRQGYRVRHTEDLFPLGFMLLFTINNYTESLTIYNYNLFWPIYIAVAFNAGQKIYSSLSESQFFLSGKYFPQQLASDAQSHI